MTFRFVFSISVYGKGGIGKSTVSSNLSYTLSKIGFDVLHVGCDPKHDSTRALVKGDAIPTFASDVHSNPKIVRIGKIGCVECGGPDPGRGCAGKGLEMLFDRLSDEKADFRVCDVLGDVVCGGFSIPARSDNCDGILIVTSGEFMSLYAANNIIRGLVNINPGKCIIGIVLNRRGDPGESERVRLFSDAVSLPVVCDIPRSGAFVRAEAKGVCISELQPDSDVALEFRRLAELISSGPILHEPHPLSEESMMELAAGNAVSPTHRSKTEHRCSFDDYDSERNMTYAEGYVLPACTSHGAADLAMRVSDLAVILHGPRNCAYLMEYAFRRRVAYISPEHGGRIPSPGIYSTCMDAGSTFTDDLGCIKDAIASAYRDGYRHFILIPTCAVEMTGSDLHGTAESLSSETGLDIRSIGSDQTFLSSKFGGTFGMLDALMSYMVPCKRTPLSVNIISRWFYNIGKDENIGSIRTILDSVGLTLNCRFLDFCSISDIGKFDSAEFDIQLGYGPLNDRISERISEVTGRERAITLETPIGLSGAVRWVDSLCDRIPTISDRREDAKRTLCMMLMDGISDIRPRTTGKRAIIYSMMEHNMDWQLETLRELGIDIVAVMIAPSFVTNHNVRHSDYGNIRVIRDAKICDIADACGPLGVDIIVTNDPDRVSRAGFRWAPLGARGLGVETAVEWALTVADCLTVPRGGWEAGL